MEDIFKNEKLYNLRINEINELMPQFGYNNGRWEKNNDSFIYMSDKNGTNKENIKITLLKNRFKNYYINNIDINPLDPVLLLQLYDKIYSEIRSEYHLSDKFSANILKLIKFLVNNIDRYNKDEYKNESQIIDLYMMAYYPERDITAKEYYVEGENFKNSEEPLYLFSYDYFNKYFSKRTKENLIKILSNHQKDLDLFSMENKYIYLSQFDFDYKTDNGLLILELLKGSGKTNIDYPKPESIRYQFIEQQTDEYYQKKSIYEPDWWRKYEFFFINQTCPLKYASDLLVHNKSFIIKYVLLSKIDYDIFNYIPDVIKRDKEFKEICVKKGYSNVSLLSTETENQVKIDDDIIYIQDELKEIKRRNKSEETKDLKTSKRVDYNKKQVKSQENGLFAEKIILNYEKQRLLEIGREDLANKVVLVSKEISENVGFDILSYDSNTNEKVFIEVKSTEGNTFDNVNITSNELRKMIENPRAWKMYYLTRTKEKEHDLYIKTGEELLEIFNFVPTSYVMKMKDLINKEEIINETSLEKHSEYKGKGI